jgi:hypothetical protein
MISDDPVPEIPQEQGSGADAVAEAAVSPTVATTGKRQAFRNIRRQIEEADLGNPGVQRLLLNMVEEGDARCDFLESYVDRYHEVDKRAAVLNEKLRTQAAVEIFFGVGVSVGSAIIGFVPSLWDQTSKGPIALSVGIVLIAGSIAARIVKR